jgi:transposase
MPDPREQELLKQIAHRDRELCRLRQENELLRQKLDSMARQFFGKKSEELNPAQLQLLFQELLAPGPAEGKESGPQTEKAESARPVKASRAKPCRTGRLPEHLPVIETVIIPPEVEAAPEQWRRIGEEISERLDYEPARFVRQRIVRPKYVSRRLVDAVPVVAALPPCILERSFATPGLLAQILVAKYCDHLPLYRQEQIYQSRHGVALSRQTMAEWVGVGADWLRLIYQQIGREVMAGDYVQIDETPVRYLAPGTGRTKLGYLWTCHRPGAETFYAWEISRSAACLQKIVPADFSGAIQCDGYSGYDAFAKTRAGIELVGCLAHVRRKFYDAYAGQKSKPAALILHLLQRIYRIESELRRSRAGPKLRQLARWGETRALMTRLHRILVLWQRKGRFLPQSLMGKAVSYALEQWPSLLPILHNGRLEVDNNLVENAIRPTAVGKKNWLFIGEANAGERSAIIYTIIASCRRHAIDPFDYLRDVLGRLPSSTNRQINELTPSAWAAARQHHAPLAHAA